MTGNDTEKFRAEMQRLGHIYRVRLTDDLIHAYAKALEDVAMFQVMLAVDAWIRTGKKFPTPADLRAMVTSGHTPGTGPRRGTFPPDIAEQRRRHHLPVTDEEFREYDRQTREGGGTLTKFERAQILRASIANTKSIVYRAAIIKRAERYERGEDVPDEDMLSVFRSAVKPK